MKQKNNRLHSSQKNAMLRARNSEQIRPYFEQVLNLRNNGEAYPVKLDDVWPLMYSDKKDATDVLKADFIYEVDYIVQKSDNQFFGQNSPKLSHTPGRPREDYYLTVECLEWFIARKIRSVFAVYREVFHLNVKANTPIAGIYPILYQGKVLYPYTPLLKAIGFSTRSGSVQKRRRTYPQNFIKVFGRNFITADMVKLLEDERKLIVLRDNMRHAQQFLPFKEEEA